MRLALRTECTLAIPRSTWTGLSPGHSATADTVAYFHRTNFFKGASVEMRDECSFMTERTVALDMPHWCCEYKPTVPNALCFSLGAAQYQRRALGIRSHLVFGGGCSQGVMDTYAAWWDNDFIVISPYYRFDSTKPIEAVQFFLFLRSIMIYGESLATEFASLSVTQFIGARPITASWRTPAHSRHCGVSKLKRTETPEN